MKPAKSLLLDRPWRQAYGASACFFPLTESWWSYNENLAAYSNQCGRILHSFVAIMAWSQWQDVDKYKAQNRYPFLPSCYEQLFSNHL